ncbi:uncharacterized protein ATNIH1004_002875 [Aspergillus tanneri]|uniref:Major facilitator superfamily (MFS) profile domain-containing protein n=1 Tax=Aspergillus tanneri TaxID=1220188 RepID=A0A5M9MXU9_9EURO|nr:uncharacterized protein ATNIH1004_002875 [Aspergillus tanneri]KAA8650194.1 hypothetical protein ATNIH1004_002875 [Aspergillus tanneri]
MTVETSCDSLRSWSPETPSEVPTAKPQSPRDLHGVNWALVVVALLLSLSLYALDNTVTNVQPKVVETFVHFSPIP